MKRHVVKDLRLREISSVDRPAQVGAVSVLIKRREEPQVELIKATFAQALTGSLLADQVRESFYKAFENMYEGKDAFRKALVDELAAGGDGTTASNDYKTWLASLVDKATVAAKAAGAGNLPAEELSKAFETAATEWLAEQETDMNPIKTTAELTAAIEKAQADGDKVTVGTVQAIHKAATELKAEALLPATGVLAKAAPAVDAARLDELEKMALALGDLTPAQKAVYDKLDKAGQKAYLLKSRDEREADLAKSAGDDPVVYTTLDGVDIRKSAGDLMISLAKRNDQLARDLAKSNATAEDAVLTKRAGDELGNLGGDLVGKKALLKALDGITDTATRDAAAAVLKSANEIGKGAFIRKGDGSKPQLTVVEGNEPGASDEEQKLDELAKAHAKANNVTFEKAYATVIQTSEGQELYKRFVAQG